MGEPNKSRYYGLGFALSAVRHLPSHLLSIPRVHFVVRKPNKGRYQGLGCTHNVVCHLPGRHPRESGDTTSASFDDVGFVSSPLSQIFDERLIHRIEELDKS